MILNQAQAEAVYAALCSLNNVGAAIRGRIEVTGDIEVKVLVTGCVQVWNTTPSANSGFESFPHQPAFAAAYNLN